MARQYGIAYCIKVFEMVSDDLSPPSPDASDEEWEKWDDTLYDITYSRLKERLKGVQWELDESWNCEI